MLRFITALVSAALLFTAGAATALTIDPNPATGLDAEVKMLLLDDDKMTFQLTVNTGGIIQIDVSMLFDDLLDPGAYSFVSDAGTYAGTGDVGMTAVNAVTEAQFIGAVGAGQTSDEFWVQFDASIPQGWEGSITFDSGAGFAEAPYAIIPEPGTLLLMGAALGGLGLLRRRRD
jgi:hypothetical protein